MMLLVAIATGASASKTVHVYPRGWGDMTGYKIAAYGWTPTEFFTDLQPDSDYPPCYKITVDDNCDYLIFCKENNCKPEKSYTGTFNVRITPMAHREIANRASEAGISINAFVKQALDKVLQEPKTEAAPAMLMDPGVPYGSGKRTLRLKIPTKDLTFAHDLACRMGWEVEE